MFMKAHTYVNDRVYRQLLIYLMTVKTTSTLTLTGQDQRLVWNGMVWFWNARMWGAGSLQEEDQL